MTSYILEIREMGYKLPFCDFDISKRNQTVLCSLFQVVTSHVGRGEGPTSSLSMNLNSISTV